MADRYTGTITGSTGEPRYIGGGQQQAQEQTRYTGDPAPKSGGGGFLGGVGHFFSQGGSDLLHAVEGIPTGVVKLVETGAHLNAAGLGLYDKRRALDESTAVGQGYLDQLKADAAHPLRHPGNTFLDALGLASLGAGTGARLAAGAKAGTLMDAVKAVAATPEITPRSLTVGNLTVNPETSRSVLGSTVQKAKDTVVQKAAGMEPKGAVGATVQDLAERHLQNKVARTVEARARMADQAARGPAGAVMKLGKKLDPGEQKALQVHAEEAPLEARIGATSQRAAEALSKSAEARDAGDLKTARYFANEAERHVNELGLLEEAGQHLVAMGGRPMVGTPRLQRVYAAMEDAASGREELLKGLGLLSDEAVQNRKTMAGRVALGATYVKPTASKLGEETPALSFHRANLTRIQRLRGLAEAKVAKQRYTSADLKRIGGIAVDATREDRLQAHLDALNKQIADLRPKHVMPEPAKTLVEERRALKRLEKFRAGLQDLAMEYRAEAEKNLGEEPLVEGPQATSQTKTITTDEFPMPSDPEALKRWKSMVSLSNKDTRLSNEEYDRLGQLRDEFRVSKTREVPVAEPSQGTVAGSSDRAQEIAGRIERLDGLIAEAGGRIPMARFPEIEAAAAALRKQLRTIRANPSSIQSGHRIILPNGDIVEPIGSANLAKLQAAESVARERVQSLEQTASKRIAPTGILGKEHFEASSQAIRIPDVLGNAKGTAAFRRGMGSQGVIGQQRPLGTTSHEFTGALREHALRDETTTKAVGESALEAARFASVKYMHDIARQAASPVQTRADDIAVRLENLPSSKKLPLEVKKFLADPESYFVKHGPDENASMVDKVKALTFIDHGKLEGAAAEDFQRLHDEGKIGWVPRRVLGSFAEPQATLRNVLGKNTKAGRALGVWDAINNAERAAILYKTAYIPPNMLGNAALNIIQQGFASIPNLARATGLVQKLPTEILARIDAAMGEGAMQSLTAHGVGRLAVASDKVGGALNRFVDLPFRRASFFYEAGKEGYKTEAELDRLLRDPALKETLTDIQLRANREIIDYGNLSNFEKEVVRRIIFFYPWVKGSSAYAFRMLREHPIKSAAQGAIGTQGYNESEGRLGPLPSYLEGLIPVGSRTLNPTNAGILNTTAQVGQVLAGILSGNVSKAADLTNMYSPVPAYLNALATRVNPQSGAKYKGGVNVGTVAKDLLFSNLPEVTLAKNIQQARHGQGSQRIFPPTVPGALGSFLLGNAVTPRVTNLDAAHRAARSEKAKMKSGR